MLGRGGMMNSTMAAVRYSRPLRIMLGVHGRIHWNVWWGLKVYEQGVPALRSIPMNVYCSEDIRPGRRWVGAELGIVHGV